MLKKYNVGIIGATGAVGREMITCLKKLDFPISNLDLFVSQKNVGELMKNEFGKIKLQTFELEKVKKLDFILMAVSGDFSHEFAPEIIKGDGVLIDNSSAWRYDDKIPLIIPEINLEQARNKKLIANPNCTTAILDIALWPLEKEFKIKKCIVSTYQEVSGAVQAAINELEEQSKNYLEKKKVKAEKFAKPIPFNLIPRIDVMTDNGYSKEEMKIVWETRKIFNKKDFNISCTAVRIPTFRAHAESVTIETEQKIDPQKAREILKNASGVEIVDDPEEFYLPMPLTATKKFNIECGRIRQSLIFGENGLDFFICGDQLLKGAALNAVQIAKGLINLP